MENYKHKCVDLTGEKALKEQSPIPILAFVISWCIQSVLMKDLSILYFIILVINFGLCQVLFQHEPRIIFLSAKAIFRWRVLTPCLTDEKYVYDLELLPSLDFILKKENDDADKW